MAYDARRIEQGYPSLGLNAYQQNTITPSMQALNAHPPSNNSIGSNSINSINNHISPSLNAASNNLGSWDRPEPGALASRRRAGSTAPSTTTTTSSRSAPEAVAAERSNPDSSHTQSAAPPSPHRRGGPSSPRSSSSPRTNNNMHQPHPASGNTSSKSVLTVALQRAQSAVLLDSANNVPAAISAYTQSVKLLRDVMERVEENTRRERERENEKEREAILKGETAEEREKRINKRLKREKFKRDEADRLRVIHNTYQERISMLLGMDSPSSDNLPTQPPPLAPLPPLPSISPLNQSPTQERNRSTTPRSSQALHQDGSRSSYQNINTSPVNNANRNLGVSLGRPDLRLIDTGGDPRDRGYPEEYYTNSPARSKPARPQTAPAPNAYTNPTSAVRNTSRPNTSANPQIPFLPGEEVDHSSPPLSPLVPMLPLHPLPMPNPGFSNPNPKPPPTMALPPIPTKAQISASPPHPYASIQNESRNTPIEVGNRNSDIVKPSKNVGPLPIVTNPPVIVRNETEGSENKYKLKVQTNVHPSNALPSVVSQNSETLPWDMDDYAYDNRPIHQPTPGDVYAGMADTPNSQHSGRTQSGSENELQSPDPASYSDPAPPYVFPERDGRSTRTNDVEAWPKAPEGFDPELKEGTFMVNSSPSEGSILQRRMIHHKGNSEDIGDSLSPIPHGLRPSSRSSDISPGMGSTASPTTSSNGYASNSLPVRMRALSQPGRSPVHVLFDPGAPTPSVPALPSVNNTSSILSNPQSSSSRTNLGLSSLMGRKAALAGISLSSQSMMPTMSLDRSLTRSSQVDKMNSRSSSSMAGPSVMTPSSSTFAFHHRAQASTSTSIQSGGPVMTSVPPPPSEMFVPVIPIRRPFDVMKRILISIESGGHITPKLYVPKILWSQSGSKLTGIETKVRMLEHILQGIEIIVRAGDPLVSPQLGSENGNRIVAARFKNELDGFVGLVEGVQSMAVKKLGYGVDGKKNSNSFSAWSSKLSRSIDRVTAGRNLDSPVTYVDCIARVFKQAQALDQHIAAILESTLGYTLLRPEDKTPLETRLKRISDFFGQVVVQFVVRDLGVLIEKSVKRIAES